MYSNSSVPLFLDSLIKAQTDLDNENNIDTNEVTGYSEITPSTTVTVINNTTNQETTSNNANTSKRRPSKSTQPSSKIINSTLPVGYFSAAGECHFNKVAKRRTGSGKRNVIRVRMGANEKLCGSGFAATLRTEQIKEIAIRLCSYVSPRRIDPFKLVRKIKFHSIIQS